MEDLKDRKCTWFELEKLSTAILLCWRCTSSNWCGLQEKVGFYKLDNLGDKAINAAEKIEYFFDQPKEPIFGDNQRKTSMVHIPRKVLGVPTSNAWNCDGCVRI